MNQSPAQHARAVRGPAVHGTRRRFRRRRVVAAAMAVAAIALPGGALTSASASEDRVLRVVLASEPSTFDVVDDSFANGRVYKAILERLVVADDATGVPSGDGLLTGWERLSPTEWVFTVREGVTFHDGQVFDATAAAYSINQYRNHPTPNPLFGRVTEASATEEGDLYVSTSAPSPEMPALLSYTYAVPNAYDAVAGLDEFNEHPIGTGPFSFVSRSHGANVVVEAYSDYWRGTPHVAGIEFSFSPEASSRGALVETGDADLALDMPFTILDQYEGNDSVEVVTTPSSQRFVFGFDTTTGPFADIALRRAAQLAIDRQSLVDNVYGGSDNAAPLDFVFGGIGFAEPLPAPWLRFDQAEAEAILAGYESSPEITLSFVVGANPNDQEVGEAIAGMLEAVGFSVTRDPLTSERFSERINPGGGLQAYIMKTSAVFPSPWSLISQYVTAESSHRLCVTPDHDAAHEAALVASDEEQQQAYWNLEELFVGTNACMFPLFSYNGSYLLSVDIGVFVPPYIGHPDYFPITFE